MAKSSPSYLSLITSAKHEPARGRKLVVIVVSKKAVAIAVKQVESRGRITRLKERLMQAGVEAWPDLPERRRSR